MIIRADEVQKFLTMHNINKVPVEVINVELAGIKEVNQGPRSFAKKIIITNVEIGMYGGVPWKKIAGIECAKIYYIIYNSFKKSSCYVPIDYQFNILVGDAGNKILTEYANHSGNLEQKFRDACNKYNPEIQEKVELACKLLKEAENISEEYGVPFNNNHTLLGGLAKGYFPQSFDAIFGELRKDDEEIIYNLTNVYQFEDQIGWQSSAGTC